MSVFGSLDILRIQLFQTPVIHQNKYMWLFQFVFCCIKKPAARMATGNWQLAAGGTVCGATKRPAMAHSLCKNLHKNYGNLSVVMVEKFGEKEASKWK